MPGEVTNREGSGVVPMKMFFPLRANPRPAAETAANPVCRRRPTRRLRSAAPSCTTVVTSYHKAKIERAALARELEASRPSPPRVPQLEEDLRAARAQCAESEEAGRAAAAKLKVAEGELTRLRRLEDNHLKELAALKKAEEEKVEGRASGEEVERQRLALRQEVTAKSEEPTAKRWVEEIGALDRGLEGRAGHAARRRPYLELRNLHLWAGGSPGCRQSYFRTSNLHLQPTEMLPQDLSNLITWLEKAPDRFLD
ncbi:hypothetical protein QYE76_028718 [Lolium multiflorum]|uniref:Uncharacterized protein n=1 Tax=Lolium multiflorum TaxID=4521 RepID=A0AAD8VHJ3_LOLMU|nr:hypothetical protein QYE76_028718 [Lolium multiflorum]